MPINYVDYVRDFGIISMDLTVTEDGNLYVLPSNLTGNLKVEVHFR